ncbi:MAG TPA: hypothetical protein VMH05_05220 [Bryobacteraceae bacterium]|nr:hypothetical protein [Bryobacteraceae bacterium]
MALSVDVPAQYGDARECIEAAHRNLERVKQLLSQPSVEAGEASAAILREVEVQLGCIAALWKAQGATRDPELRLALERIQREVAFLAEFFARTERLFQGWIGAVQSKRSGYNGHGQTAPLVLVNRVNLEG